MNPAFGHAAPHTDLGLELRRPQTLGPQVGDVRRAFRGKPPQGGSRQRPSHGRTRRSRRRHRARGCGRCRAPCIPSSSSASSTANPNFLAATLKRLPAEAEFAAPLIVCNSDHRFLVRRRPPAGIAPRAIVLEPVARNTAPAAAVAAMFAQQDPAGILALMPSDHVIEDEPGFVAAVAAPPRWRRGKLVLFGITPVGRTPATAISGAGAPGCAGLAVYRRRRLHGEAGRGTPPGSYLAAGNYSWNSGIFVLGARAFLDELARLGPASWRRRGRRSPRPRRIWASCGSTPRPSPRRPPSPSTTR